MDGFKALNGSSMAMAHALAAASAFIDDMPNAESLAASRALDYAAKNPVQGITASFNPATDMQIWLDEKKVRVTANFLRDRGNPMPTMFARVFGITDVNVRTIATAEARGIPANTALTTRTNNCVSLAAPNMISGMRLSASISREYMPAECP